MFVFGLKFGWFGFDVELKHWEDLSFPIESKLGWWTQNE
jgi:hypothetical protein